MYSTGIPSILYQKSVWVLVYTIIIVHEVYNNKVGVLKIVGVVVLWEKVLHKHYLPKCTLIKTVVHFFQC